MIFVISTLILIGLGLLVATFLSCADNETLQKWFKNIPKKTEKIEHSVKNEQEPRVIITIPKLSDLLDIADEINLINPGSLFAVRIQQTREEWIFLKDKHSIRSVKINNF